MPFLSSLPGFFRKNKLRRQSGRPNNELGGLTPPGPPQLYITALDGERELVTAASPPSQTSGIVCRAQNTTINNAASNEHRTGEPEESCVSQGGSNSSGPPQINTNVLDDESGFVTALSQPSQMPGILYRAQNTTLNNAVFIGNQIVEAEESAAMKKLLTHTDPNAAVDSDARHPLPTCHPKTRREIRNKLTNLFNDISREYMMAWLSGAAGTGKTAVGQTFSMKCDEKHRLGATFFFSRPNGRNRYKTVVPTLAYQLTVHCPSYRIALIARIEKDQHILDKAPPVQFKKLIVEPLLAVRSQITDTFLMLLDGVDECGAHPNDVYEREREQRELIKMIAESVRNHRDLPLFWLFCSRPEHHLQKGFADVGAICRHEELVIDAKCREEVETVLRDGFAKIAKDRDVIPPGPDGWPSKEEFDKVESAVSGLHVFGAAILKDIEYSDSPVRQLKSLIPFLERVASAGSSRSIAVMDLFYIRILEDVPKIEVPTTLKIIGALITMPDPENLSAQALCNFLRIDPNDFSTALRKVHSVVDIPPPQSVHDKSLHLYHASFSDFLTNASRSGEFFIDTQKVVVELIKSFFFWHQLHSNLFHSSDLPFVDCDKLEHGHDPLPLANLKWITQAANHQAISDMICRYTEQNCFLLFGRLSNEHDEELINFLPNSDLRHTSTPWQWHIFDFLKWVSKHDLSRGFIRTEPKDDVDRKLLNYLATVTEGIISPTSFPLDWATRKAIYREYLLIGRDTQSVIVWVTRTHEDWGIMALNLDRAPGGLIIQEYKNSIMFKKWVEVTQPPGD